MNVEDAAFVLKRLEESIASRLPYSCAYRANRPDGEIHWVEAAGNLVLDAAGQPVKPIGVCADVTARKGAEQGLADAQARYQTLLNLAPDLIVAWDAQGKCVSVSQSLEARRVA